MLSENDVTALTIVYVITVVSEITLSQRSKWALDDVRLIYIQAQHDILTAVT